MSEMIHRLIVSRIYPSAKIARIAAPNTAMAQPPPFAGRKARGRNDSLNGSGWGSSYC
jgi:hypothetical protein